MSSALAVVDLAVPPAALEPAPEASTLKLVFLWNGAAVGEQLIELEERPCTLAIPEAILRQARETELTERLRPSLAPAPAREAPSVSVVVCTLGRPGPLAACLASLDALRRTPGEVLVVNNNPSDARPRTVAEQHGARVVDEPRRGLSAARNAGIRAARGELVAFIDDDCEVAPGWLEDLARDFEDPLVAVVVGYVGPRELETEAQWLFEAQGGFERHFRRERFDGAADGPWAAGGLGDGNSFFRRSVLEAHGGFSEVMGPGTAARSAQDADLFHRLLGHGWRLQFTPARVAWHRHRRELEALAATLEGYTTGLSAHAARSLLGRRDLTALRMWHWWARRYFPQLARDALRDPRSGRWLLLGAQARGALLGPLRARGALRGGGPEPGIAPRPAPAATERVAVTAELPAASVVLASHDRRDRLVQTLRALRGQTLPPERFEVVVILDGSTDGSLEAARALEPELPLRVEAQASLGLATSRNRGAELSGHPLVVFLDDDIVPEPGLVAAHAAAHAGSREAVVMGYHPPVVDLERWWAQGVRAWWEDHFRRKRAPGWHPTFVDYCDGNSSLPRALFQRLGGFDQAFSGGRRQDWELAIRALAEGVAFRMELPRAPPTTPMIRSRLRCAPPTKRGATTSCSSASTRSPPDGSASGAPGRRHRCGGGQRSGSAEGSTTRAGSPRPTRSRPPAPAAPGGGSPPWRWSSPTTRARTRRSLRVSGLRCSRP